VTAQPSSDVTGTTQSSTPAAVAYADYVSQGLKLNMQRGQPSEADFNLSNGLLSAVGEADLHLADGTDVRNYSPDSKGLPSARALFGRYLDVPGEQVIVWNNASLELQAHVLSLMLLRGRLDAGPWAGTNPKIIVNIPGYDRHFKLLQTLGFELVPVDMQADGPDLDAIERLAAADPSIRGILFVPTYSNPGGETISEAKARRLVALTAANADFTVFADDAYRVHHLDPENRDTPVNLIALAAEVGQPDRVFTFASTSKITFAGAGLGFVASSPANIAFLHSYLNALSIGPNKIEQLRHVRFLESYPGGVDGLMADHGRLVAPKFAAVSDILAEELGDSALATWSKPRGGYFISLDTKLPVASRVIELAAAAGVSLTPAGATYPNGQDPTNRNIRLAPTRPDLAEVKLAMHVVATCIRLASEEYEAARRMRTATS